MARSPRTLLVLAFAIFCTLIFLYRMPGLYAGRQARNIKDTSVSSSPLFVGFRANWPLLQQAVVSYLAAGWPADQIFVVDNTGTMDANARGLLTPANPSYLPYDQLTQRGVNIITTPTQLTFSQLQNFYLSTAISHSRPGYFWSHQDVAVLPSSPTASFHQEVHACLNQKLLAPDREPGAVLFSKQDIPNAPDSLTYMNVAAARAIGGWDNAIPYYCTDWDYYSRLRMANYSTPDCKAGTMFDVATVVEDAPKMFFEALRPTVKAKAAGEKISSDAALDARFNALQERLKKMGNAKVDNGRNAWHGRQTGGPGEPFSVDPLVAKHVFDGLIGFSRKMFEDKWGEKNTEFMDEAGLTLADMWKLVLEHKG